ncbi:unnamed protein product [Rangifer tarandus platyrhynchus]|uniref:Uncharacterized protein n=1 Tax=Rangifer tarandus platyrhynchus TaxID=3082113 RepID=A0AC60A453_RANTA
MVKVVHEGSGAARPGRGLTSRAQRPDLAASPSRARLGQECAYSRVWQREHQLRGSSRLVNRVAKLRTRLDHWRPRGAPPPAG